MSNPKVRGPFAGPPEKDHLMEHRDYQTPESVVEMFQVAPLFRKYAYRCRGPVRLPSELRLFCETAKCGGERVFGLVDTASSFECCTYRCNNCGTATYRFLLNWDRKHEQEMHSVVSMDGDAWEALNYEVGNVAKMGQDPAPRENVSSALVKRLGETHALYYQNAVRLRNFGAGIGALAYLRRVVEDTANELLSIVVEESRAEGNDVETQAIERAQTSRVFDEKIVFAKRLVPERLMPGGHNPLDKLHDLASGGLHGLGDDECCDKFDQARRVFEYFFEELPRQHERQSGFVKSLSDLNKPV